MKLKRILLLGLAALMLLACQEKPKPDNGKDTKLEVNGTPITAEGSIVYGSIADETGKPVSGVVVSDGYNCVKTDANGVYQMTRFKTARFVFYSTPAEYKVNTTSDDLPKFYSEIVSKNIADRHDFVLKKATKESKFAIFCLADPQCKTASDVSRFTHETMVDVKALANEYISAGTPVYGMTLGDIIYDTPNLWGNLKTSMSNQGFPIFQTIGNHDHLASETSDIKAVMGFEDTFGPTNYSFNRGDAHIVSMDNILYLGDKKYNGGITDQQLEWLRQDLSFVSKDKIIIFCAHIPFRGLTSQTSESYKNGQEVLNLLSEFAEAHIMIGHTHYNQKWVHSVNGKTIQEHVHGATCGGWWASTFCSDGTPNGYGVYEIQGNKVKNMYYKSTGFDKSYQMRAYPGQQLFGEKSGIKFGWAANNPGNATLDKPGSVVVNVWNAFVSKYKATGSLLWTVELWQDGQKVANMTELSSKEYWAYGNFLINYGKGDTSTWNSTRHHLYRGVLPRGNTVTDSDEALNFEIKVTDHLGNVYICNSLQRTL